MSNTSTTNKDNRAVAELATEAGSTLQFVSPDSILTNPLSQNLHLEGKGVSVTQDYGDITYYEFSPQVNELVNAILNDNQNTLGHLSSITEDVISNINSTSNNLVGMVEESSNTLVGMFEAIKTPLNKYLPWLGVLIVLWIIYKVASK